LPIVQEIENSGDGGVGQLGDLETRFFDHSFRGPDQGQSLSNTFGFGVLRNPNTCEGANKEC
jgi:hypothetical protein